MLEENNGKLPRGTFDDDPRIIQLPSPHQETGELTFRVIVERGPPLKLDSGRMYTPLGVVMSNQLGRSGYVTAMMKDGYVVISLVRSDAE